ncbi:MAG: ATP-binding protein [Salinivenus sp.]
MNRLLLLPAVLLLVASVHADELPYRRYTVADGLPNEDVYALAQADDGRLYVGTPGGLSVYNGQQFRPVEIPDSIGAAQVDHIVADGRSVWAGTSNGRVLKVRARRVTRVLPKVRSIERLLVRRDTLHIVARRTYWALPPDAKRPLRHPPNVSFRLPGRKTQADVGRGLEDGDFGPGGHLWVLDAQLGPGRLQPDGSVDFAGVPHGSGSQGWWRHLRFGPDGTALLYGRKTVYRFHPASARLTPLLDHGQNFSFSRGVAYVPSLEGVARLAWSDSSGIRMLTPLDEKLGLQNVKARCVLRDHEGGLWIGTRGGLLYLFAPTVRHISRLDGAPLVYVNHFTRTARGALWVNTWGSGLIRLRPQRARVTPRGAARWMTVRSRDGHMYALNQHGWFRRTSDGAWNRLAPRNGAVQGVVGRKGIGYFFHNRGLYRHDPNTPESPVQLFSWKASNNGPHTHTLAPNGDVILRAQGHLLRGTPSPGNAPIRFDTLAVLPDYADDAARYMAFDARGTAWLAFWHRGLVRVETAGDSARVDPVLPGRSLMSVTLSGDSLVFAGARDGLYVIDQRDGTLRRHLTAADGLLATTTQSATIYEDTLYASHPRGLTAMPVSSLFHAPSPPDVLLTHIERDFEEVSPRAAPRFDAADRTVGIGFAATAFTNPKRVRYAYRLRPRDTTWTATQEGFTRYVDLSPGTYRFEVRARRAGGSFGEATTYTFTIPHHFYETSWFQLLCLLFLGLAGVGAYRWRVHALRRRQRTLEEKVEHRTEQLRREKEKTEAQAERLAELDEAKNRFFANLSHEFRTPLTLILEPLSDALDGAFGTVPEPLREQLRLMQRNAERLRGLIGQLLDLTRLEAGRLELHAEPGDLVAFTRELVQAFTPMAEREEVTLHFRPGPDRLPASFDPDKLEQVLSNLLSNALTYTPEGGTVWVTVSARTSGDAPEGEIVVKDTGPGLTEEELRRIFDRFEQARGTERTERDGLGLGLALANELVELHEGTLRAESEPGLGTAFTVRLPIPEREHGSRRAREREHADDRQKRRDGAWEAPPGVEGRGSSIESTEQTAEQTNGASVPPRPHAPTLLIVEDNADMRAYLRRHLSADYTVVEAEDGEAGLRAAREHEPDLIVSDVMMPEMDGTALCEAIKADEALQTIPVVLLTAKATSADAVEGLECGADDYISKPFDVEELCARIERLLSTREQLRDRFSETMQVEPTGETTAVENAPFLEEVLAVVEAHLGDAHFGAEDLAAEMALSPRQLTRRLKEAAGETPAALIRRLRLEHAARLLDDEARTVSETAHAVGYDSPSHFAKAFRKHVGCAPSDYGEE